MWIGLHWHLSAALSPPELAVIDAKTPLWQHIQNSGQNNLGSILSLSNIALAPCISNRILLLENIQGYEILSAQILPF